MLKWIKEKFSKEEKIKEEDLDTQISEEKVQTAEVTEENSSVEENTVYNKEEVEATEETNSIEDLIEREYIVNGEEALTPENFFTSECEEVTESETKEISFFENLKRGLSKTRKSVGNKLNLILGNFINIDDEMMDELEEILISADIGMNTTMTLIDNLRETIIDQKIKDATQVKPLLKEEILKIMEKENMDHNINLDGPKVILIVGVNGVGKTTTIGKLASQFKLQNKKVLIAAGDTFRAAAIEQVKHWGKLSNTDVIAHSEGSDPAAVIYDSIQAAKSRNIDILICDTAGRLHNKANLMNELSKISRVIEKEYPEAKKETLLILDATTGQNALNQAKVFKEATNITGIVLTKLDGTAKGGIVIALQNEIEIPIKLIGVGEGINDLQKFNSEEFIEAIFE